MADLSERKRIFIENERTCK